jgi:hypothetical protein
VACGLFDGLAHEPRRHGVQPVRVVLPGRPAGRRRLLLPSWIVELVAVPRSTVALVGSTAA